jgi:hypothetical protein
MRIIMTQAEYDKLVGNCLDAFCHRCPFHSKDGVIDGICVAEWIKEQKIVIID